MAASFGVQLKKPDKIGDTKGPVHTPGGAIRSDFKTKPVSDLKAMFNKKDEEAKGSEVNVKKVNSVETTTAQKSNQTKTVKTEFSSTFSTSKFGKDVGGKGLSEDDKTAFAALKNKLNTTDLDKLDASEPVLAISKTYGGNNAFKATVETKKVVRAGGENIPVTKTDAASVLSFGLTKLRTRPGFLKSEEAANESALKNTQGQRVTSSRSQSPTRLKKDKYIPGAAKGWKGSGDEEAEDKTGKFDNSLIGKVRTEVKAEKEVKVKGFRSVSPVNLALNSSDDSSGSSNLSPRGYKPNTEFSTRKDADDAKTDINKNIKKFEIAKTDKSVFKTDNQNQVKSESKRTITKTSSSSSLLEDKGSEQKPKLSAVEQLAQDRDRIKSKRNSGSFSSDSDKGKRSPKTKGEFKWLDQGRISLEEFKEQTKAKSEGHRPLSRASSSGSNSSLSRSDASNMKARIERFASPDFKDSSQLKPERTTVASSALSKTEFTRRDFTVSKKIDPSRFKDIKKGFECQRIETRTPSPQDRKQPINIKTDKRLLERKQSFEEGVVYRKKSYEKRELISPRDRGNVLQTVKALTELDAKAKAQPVIMRRTHSLPSESLDDDSSAYDDTAQYYDEIQCRRMEDDVSNEGDISSEADLIYEEIPANLTEENGWFLTLFCT